MQLSASIVRDRLPWIVLFLLGCLSAAFVSLPLRTGQVGYDSAASVLYFDRLTAGRQLEAFVTATPKPLLTIVYGVIHALFGDWRVISWLAIVAFGLSVSLAGALALRLGGVTAAAFTAAAFLTSPTLLLDVSLSYALVWALLGWLAAGLALTDRRPRYGLAGLALLLAGMARFESLLLAAAAVVAVAVWVLLARRRRVAGPPRRAWLVAIGLLALPIQLLHDWLLTGEPLFSQIVPVRGSVGAPLLGAVGRAVWLGQRYLDSGALVALALLGAILLIRRRRWPVLAGLAVLGPGVGAFLIYLEARQIYVSTRYAGPIDLAVLFAAGIGFGAVAVPALSGMLGAVAGSRRAGLRIAVSALAAILIAASSRTLLAAVSTSRNNLALHRATDAAERVIAPALTAGAGSRDVPAARPGAWSEAPSNAVLLVPVLLRPQMAVDLGLPLTAVDGLDASRLAPGGRGLRVGQIVFHHRRADGPDAAFAILEVSAATTVGSLRIVPLASDVRLGWWVVRIDSAPSG